ncbi:hypothetical protein DFH08DRAFT_1028617 [Mycena albidolilacea]|uniref:Uncharacterized protein n=1 Tax=Mycena albidolilacea TaxID=1033008 RepID=A0AAD6ZIW0_9AGAR|nr:hypothetical protein DFH08DRAFT_1028617 [Mycena albidolilacea]
MRARRLLHPAPSAQPQLPRPTHGNQGTGGGRSPTISARHLPPAPAPIRRPRPPRQMYPLPACTHPHSRSHPTHLSRSVFLQCSASSCIHPSFLSPPRTRNTPPRARDTPVLQRTNHLQRANTGRLSPPLTLPSSAFSSRPSPPLTPPAHGALPPLSRSLGTPTPARARDILYKRATAASAPPHPAAPHRATDRLPPAHILPSSSPSLISPVPWLLYLRHINSRANLPPPTDEKRVRCTAPPRPSARSWTDPDPRM